MADYTKIYTIDFTEHGDSVFTGVDKTEDNIDSLVGWVNDLKDNYASATAPTSPVPSEGQLWWDSTNNRLNIYDGSNWYYYLGDGKLYLRDSNDSHYLNITWNEDDTSARTLNLLVAGGNRSLTLNENFVIGDGSAGTVTFSAASKVLTVADSATISGATVNSVVTDSGTATPATQAFTIAGGEGIDTSGSGATVTIAGELATTTNAGVASFNTSHFTVTSGAVSIKDGYAPSPWAITTGTYTATPASTSTLTMTTDLTATIIPGMPLKYKISATYYYAICTAITSILLTIAGAPLSGDVLELYYGGKERVKQFVIPVNGLYEDATNTALILSDCAYQLTWFKSTAYCVAYKFYSKVHDSHATHGKATILINGTELNTSAGGLTIAADATWYSTVVDIAVAAYDINYNEPIEISVTKGGTGDATDLTGVLIIVEP